MSLGDDVRHLAINARAVVMASFDSRATDIMLRTHFLFPALAPARVS
jgi:hypothetical protein